MSGNINSLDDLEKYENDFLNSDKSNSKVSPKVAKKEEPKTPMNKRKTKVVIEKEKDNSKKETKNNPFDTKKKMAFNPKFAGKNIKNIDFKSLLKKMDIMWILWLALLGLAVYGYNTDVMNKIKELPTVKKDITILKGNVKKQEIELESLEKIKLDSSSLDKKEEVLDNHLKDDYSERDIEQTNTLYTIAKEVGLDIDSLQKISVKRDESKVSRLGLQLEDEGIDNFYNQAWYTKYIISTLSSEEVILRFKEKIEGKVAFVFDGFSLNRSEGDIKYSFSIKAFYNLTENKDEQVK